MLGNFQLPEIAPYSVTPFETVETLMKIFPTFLNGYRCIIKSFSVPLKENLMKNTLDVASKLQQLSVKFTVFVNDSRSAKDLKLPIKKSVLEILNIDENEGNRTSECVTLNFVLNTLKQDKSNYQSCTYNGLLNAFAYIISVLLYQRYVKLSNNAISSA